MRFEQAGIFMSACLIFDVMEKVVLISRRGYGIIFYDC